MMANISIKGSSQVKPSMLDEPRESSREVVLHNGEDEGDVQVIRLRCWFAAAFDGSKSSEL